MAGRHVSRVRALYKRVLQLHRVLPPDLKSLGDQYVKDEFRRHKTVGSDEAQRFLQEWETQLACTQVIKSFIAHAKPVWWSLHTDAHEIVSGIGGFLVSLTSRMKPWTLTVYATVLSQQANENRQNSTGKACFGTFLPEEKLNDFRDEQIGQLQELMQEATKPNRQFSISESTKPKF